MLRVQASTIGHTTFCSMPMHAQAAMQRQRCMRQRPRRVCAGASRNRARQTVRRQSRKACSTKRLSRQRCQRRWTDRRDLRLAAQVALILPGGVASFVPSSACRVGRFVAEASFRRSSACVAAASLRTNFWRPCLHGNVVRWQTLKGTPETLKP